MKPPIVLDACGLRITFQRQADRFAHQIALVEHGKLVPLLASIEGDADQIFPPSPPFQHLERDIARDGSRVVLLTGIAGRAHWSASVKLSRAAPHVSFDVAARIHAPPERLGSTYRFAQPPNVSLATQSCEQVPLYSNWRLIASANDAQAPSQITTSGSLCSIQPAPLPTAPWPRTIRWSYTMVGASARHRF